MIPKLLTAALVIFTFSRTTHAQLTEPSNFNMTPYSGTWTNSEASHLLRRTLFGPTRVQINNAVSSGMDITVDELLSVSGWSSYPLVYQVNDSLGVIGSTWINVLFPASGKGTVNSTRERSLLAWKMEMAFEEDSTIAQKMDLFWHNHFAVEFLTDAKASYQYFELIRSHTLGNFKTLVKEMTIEPAMLEFLNGEDNIGSNPNENYSRELLELYSIGKGIEIVTGDYSRYTELDVAEGARILSGYSNIGMRSESIPTPYSQFDLADHDNNSKTLSYHFSDAVITGNGATEYEDYIDIVFAHPEFASFICESIYRFFVNNDITPQVESLVIDEMATTLVANNFEILPVMEQLLKSEHFYDVALRGSLIKSPMDFFFSMYNPLNESVLFDTVSNYTIQNKIHNDLINIGMDLSTPPSVAGWTAYYQAPGYSQNWLTSVYLQKRHALIDSKIAPPTQSYSGNGNNYRINALSLLNSLPTPANADDVVDDLIEIFLVDGLNVSDRDMLLNTLTDNLPVFEWTILYADYLIDPVANETDVHDLFKATLAVLFKLYTFQTM